MLLGFTNICLTSVTDTQNTFGTNNAHIDQEKHHSRDTNKMQITLKPSRKKTLGQQGAELYNIKLQVNKPSQVNNRLSTICPAEPLGLVPVLYCIRYFQLHAHTSPT